MLMIKESITILGMSCNSCAKSIQNNMNKNAGIENALVNFETKELSFEYNGDIVDIKEIRMSIENMGYVIENNTVKKNNIFPKSKSTCSCG